MRPSATMLALVLLLLLPRAVSAAGQEVLHYPSAWQGIWQLNVVLRDCTTRDTILVDVMTDTLCDGEALNQGLNCTGTVTDTQFDYTCTSNFNVFPGCTGVNTLRGVATRSGDSYTSNVTFTTSFVGDCSLPEGCTEYVTTATRTGSAPAGCGTPVEVSTWGRIKARFGE